MKTETLLRPIQEYSCVVASIGLSAFIYFYGEIFYILPVVGTPVSLMFFLWGLFRLMQARRLAFYQQHLTVAPRFDMKMSEVPRMKSKDFYGKGFEWKSKHVARLEEANTTDNEKFLKNSWNVRLGNYLSIKSQKLGLNSFDSLITADNKYNPFRPLPKIGGTPQLHGVGLFDGEKEIIHDMDERKGHTEIDGTTGAGKTVLLRLLILQDVSRGQPTIVFDPKNDKDLFEATYASAKLVGKEDKFIHFNLGFPEESARYSPFSNNTRMTEVATITTSSLPSEGDASSFKEFAWRYVNTIQLVLFEMGEKATYQSILNYSTDIDTLFVKYCNFSFKRNKDRFEKALENIDLSEEGKRKDRSIEQWDITARQWIMRIRIIKKIYPDLIDSNMKSLISVLEHEKMHFQKLVASLYPLLEKLTSGAMSEILSPKYDDIDDDRVVLDWRKVLKGDYVVYCGFDAMSDTTVASAISAAMIADLVSVAGEVYKHGTNPGLPKEYENKIKTANFYFDEGSDLLSEELLPLLNKGRGAGMKITLSTQAPLADAESKLGSKAKATKALSNFNTRIVLRVITEETARTFVNQLGEAVYYQNMVFSGVTDSTNVGSTVDFTSSNQNRKAVTKDSILKVNDLMNLPRGHAFLTMNGKLYKLRIPFVKVDKDLLPPKIKKISNQMENTAPSNWYVDRWYNRQYKLTDLEERKKERKKDSRYKSKNDGYAFDALNQVERLDEIDDQVI